MRLSNHHSNELQTRSTAARIFSRLTPANKVVFEVSTIKSLKRELFSLHAVAAAVPCRRAMNKILNIEQVKLCLNLFNFERLSTNTVRHTMKFSLRFRE